MRGTGIGKTMHKVGIITIKEQAPYPRLNNTPIGRLGAVETGVEL